MPGINKGGEDIPNNTYGFEIEFCSHDNSVFAFTHVDTAAITVTRQGGQFSDEWKIETDSGNVLELVSPPLRFPQIGDAYAFKKLLADTLSKSVQPSCIYGEWYQRNAENLTTLFSRYYGACNLNFALATYDQVQPQINVENVDDGINIQAAQVRLARNAFAWKDYVNATVVARSEKDWQEGYSSQVNMPMTIEGYFLYSVARKLLKSQKRFAAMVEQPETLVAVSVEKLERYLSTWFWRNIEFSVFVWNAKLLFGDPVLSQIHSLLPPDGERALFISELPHLRVEDRDLKISRAIYDQIINIMPVVYAAPRAECPPAMLKQLAILYVATGKMLTGALGSLSEKNQLDLQTIAWNVGSTEGMAPPVVQTDQIMAQRRWLEYHSSMKDLTGLWFKGALLDVLAKEQVAVTLPRDGITIWFAVLGTYVSIMNAERWDTGRVYTDDLNGLHIQELSQRIAQIQDQYIAYIAGLNGVIPPFKLPPRSERPFLHYGQWPNSEWEGRYDTMVDAIPPHDTVGWSYLVEHRFH